MVGFCAQQYHKTIMKLAHASIMSWLLAEKKDHSEGIIKFFWPCISSDIKRYCCSCDICQRTIAKGKTARATLGSMPIIDTPFQRVAIDLVGQLEPRTDSKNKYILTLVDYATKYPEAVALPSIETETFAETLVSMFSRVGVPKEVLTDMGSQFTSALMKEVHRCYPSSSLSRPQINLAEGFIGMLKKC